MSRLTALLLILAAAHAQAERYCVATATQFQNALTQSAASPDDSIIDVVTGVYDFNAPAGGAAIAYSSNSSLTITGGWNAGCAALTSRDPEQTLLRVANTGRLMQLFSKARARTTSH